MTTLGQIIKSDTVLMRQALKGIAMGAVHGIYTPALLNTGLKHFFINDKSKDKSEIEIASHDVMQVGSAATVSVVSAVYAIEKGMTLEYFGALTATNLADYLVHAYKRSKK